jgi:hypothetical protein
MPFGLLGELDPLSRQLFVLAFDLGIANAARELPAFCRVGAEFLGSRLHVELFVGPTSNADGHRPSMQVRYEFRRDAM